MQKKFVITGIAALSVVTLLSACSSSTPATSEPASVDSTANTAGFNDDDVMFAQMMIPHHEQAIEMADIALDPSVGAGKAITDLATQIKAAQDPEISQMKGLLSTWGKPLASDSGMDHGSMMSGMMTTDEMDALGKLTGAEFDKAWAKGMIAHHQGAIDMANDVLANGTNTEINTLAKAIISGQTAEIEVLRGLVG